MVTGWSYLVASNGVPASWSSCTRTFPREVTRSERCILPPDICGASGTVTVPSHSPARLLMDAKDFCASDGTGATGFCASVWAKIKVESDIRITDSIIRSDFMFHSPEEFQSFFASGQGDSLALLQLMAARIARYAIYCYS